MKPEAFNRLLRELKTSERAFRQIYEYYLPKIKYHVYRKYGNDVDFEDVAHELFTKLIRMESPPNVDNPTAWIYKICDNIILDEFRKNKQTLPIDERTASAPTAGGFTLSETETNSDFFALLSQLDGESAEIVKLVIWDGYNLKEVSQLLNLSHGATRQKYSRALKKLKKYL